MKAITLGAFGLLCAGIASNTASAAPLGMGVMSGLSDQQGVVEQVNHKGNWSGKKRYWRHRNNNNWGGKHWRHGNNNNWGGRHWRHGNNDNDNWGWWGLPLGLGVGMALTAPYYNGYGNGYGYGYGNGYGNSHVDYCLRRYRSYDPRTNTFMGYDGRRHECIGPY